MNTFTLGLVVEGVTDLPVIQCIVAHHLSEAGVREVRFRSLQPKYDRTSDEWGEGGYHAVKAWCLRNDPQKRVELFLRPLFAGDETCDALLIHLDGDLAERFAEEVGRPEWAENPSAAERGRVIGHLLDRWLWSEPGERAEEALHVPLVAVQATETWIIAGARPDLADPEAVEPVAALLALSPGLGDQRRPGHLKKDPKRWRRLTRRYVDGNERSIIGRCPHLRSALDALVELTENESALR